ncbi:histidine triad (HIT) family protein [Kribbella voronezhensis]|uniref:Histidine triad (HIT) family protein n=1 Tax=Kribbella voronezhensis TaxID=2512212 RepID=A0A4R7T4N3_9ACTN|nr:HIT family protein [Kribbella voronezhensis]TDU86575.1 histidine triad (HIT) family protein [Kribbella voronezhensis]
MADCLFCSIIAGSTPAHLVYESPEVLGFLDIRPVFKGHTLLVPREHIATMVELPDELTVPLFGAARAVAAAVRTAYGAQGSFVAVNNVVSQSVPHLHVHVVPRTKGDGLRGFFWPRTKYADDDEAASYAEKLRTTLAG